MAQLSIVAVTLSLCTFAICYIGRDLALRVPGTKAKMTCPPPPVARDRTAEFCRAAHVAWPRKSASASAPVWRANLLAAHRALEASGGSNSSDWREHDLRVLVEGCVQRAANARNDSERRHWSEAKRLALHWHAPLQRATFSARPMRGAAREQGAAVRDIERRLTRVSVLYSTVNEMVQRQAFAIDGVERAVDSIELRVDAAERELHDAAPREWRTRRWRWYWVLWPRSLRTRLLAAALALLALNYMALIVYAARDAP